MVRRIVSSQIKSCGIVIVFENGERGRIEVIQAVIKCNTNSAAREGAGVKAAEALGEGKYVASQTLECLHSFFELRHGHVELRVPFVFALGGDAVITEDE